MNNIACLYFEGADSKVALFQKEEGVLKLVKAISIDTSLEYEEQKQNSKEAEKKDLNKSGGIEFLNEGLNSYNQIYLQKLNEFFVGEDLANCGFIPILTEPSIYFQKVDDKKDLANLNISKNGKIETVIDYIDLADGNKLAVYPSGRTPYLSTIDSLARMNNRRFLRIEAVKSAEISLASFVIRKFKPEPDKMILILYIGKEYCKVVFTQGDKIHHIGSTLSVGKNSFNAHNVIVSKLLLELEHAGVSNVNDIIITGEENSENLISLLQESYPASQVRFVETNLIDEDKIESMNISSSFTIPAAVAEEYFNEIDNNEVGINLLPPYVKEQQKAIQLGWYGYMMIALILLSIGFFTYSAVSNINREDFLDSEIKRLTIIQEQNRDDVEKIRGYQRKLENVGQTRTLMNNIAIGSGVISDQLEKLSNFVETNQDLWLSNLVLDPLYNLKLEGYTVTRPIVRQLSDSYNTATLQSIIFEQIKELESYKFSIDAGKIVEGRVENEPQN